MAFVVKTNASHGTIVNVGPISVPASGGTETVVNTHTITQLQQNGIFRAFLVDNAYDVGTTSTLIMNDGTGDIAQADVIAFIDTYLLPVTGAYSVGVRDDTGVETTEADELLSTGATLNHVLTADGSGTISWAAAPGAVGGEANTASNQGVGGVGFFIGKMGIDLEFKNLNSDASITVANDAGNDEVDINVNYAVPVSIGTANAQGAALTAAASNHVHDHGAQTVGTHHAVATSTASGFQPQSNLNASVNPTANEDSGDGYLVGSTWINTTADTSWVCVDNTLTAAVWVETTQAGGAPASTIVEATADTTTTATADELVASMTLTPASGTYMVWFTGSVDHSANNGTAFMSIYSAGAQVAGSERAFGRGAGQGNVTTPFTCVARVTVNGSQAIEGQWRVGSGTGTMHERSVAIIEVS